MKLAILTGGLLPIPAVQGGAIENFIDYYLDYNDRMKLHDITVYSPWDPKVSNHPALASSVNHYHYIDVTSLRARIGRRLYKIFQPSDDYYNYFIEYYFEKVFTDLKKKIFDYIIIENGAGLAYKLSQRGFKNLILHMNNDLLNSNTPHHDEIYNSYVKIITVSNYIKGRVSTIQPVNNIQVLNNGIDLEIFSRKESSSVTRKNMGFSEDDFVIVYSGRINNEKGVSELIDAMLMLKDYPNIKLMIIGGTFFGNSSNEDDFVRSLKEKSRSISDRLVFTGFIPYEKVPEYLQIADIAALPSIWDDPFPTTELEAQAMGLPIITTVRGGIPEEVCPEDAILLETDNHIVDNLAKSILELYSNLDRRKQMSKVALERAGRFSKEIFAEKFFAAIEEK
jgi:glycosyltransferase involved in cell wall biosynthesis